MSHPFRGSWNSSRHSVPVAVGVAFVCLGGACSRGSLPTSVGPPAEPVTLTVGYPHVTGEDPLHGIQQAARLASFEGLTTQGLDGRPVPRLAAGWTESLDGLIWTISLRPSALFHDGSPVDALSVKQSLDQSLRSNQAGLSPGLEDILSLEASAQHTLTIRLKQRSTFLLDDLETPITKLDSKGLAIGTGPYLTGSTSTGETAMVAFPQYYRVAPAISRVVWRVYPTVRTAWAAMMRGDVDFLYEVGPETLEFLQAETSVGLYSFLRNYVYAVVFNAKRPIFRDPEVRRALNYAIDRKTLVDQAFSGHGRMAGGPAWPLHWAHDSAVPGYSYDPTRAVASLDKTWAPHLRRGDDNSARMHFVCLLPENFALWERLGLLVQRNLSEIGIDMRFEAVPFERFNQRIAEGDFDVVLMEMISGFSVSRPFFFWHSSSRSNFSGYSNKLLDKALDDIRRATGDAQYRDAFRRFQQATFDDPPGIFLAWGETARAVNRRFEVQRAPGGDIRMTMGDWRLAGNRTRAAN